jgi:hypothetical protein
LCIIILKEEKTWYKIKHPHSHSGLSEELMQQQSSLLVPSKLGWARDETHRSRKTKMKRRGGKGKVIKTRKRGKYNKNGNTKKATKDKQKERKKTNIKSNERGGTEDQGSST